jgi:hypothetical protein
LYYCITCCLSIILLVIMLFLHWNIKIKYLITLFSKLQKIMFLSAFIFSVFICWSDATKCPFLYQTISFKMVCTSGRLLCVSWELKFVIQIFHINKERNIIFCSLLKRVCVCYPWAPVKSTIAFYLFQLQNHWHVIVIKQNHCLYCMA